MKFLQLVVSLVVQLFAQEPSRKEVLLARTGNPNDLFWPEARHNALFLVGGDETKLLAITREEAEPNLLEDKILSFFLQAESLETVEADEPEHDEPAAPEAEEPTGDETGEDTLAYDADPDLANGDPEVLESIAANIPAGEMAGRQGEAAELAQAAAAAASQAKRKTQPQPRKGKA